MATISSAIHKSKSSPGPQPTCIDPQEIFFWNNPEQHSYRSAPLHSSDANNTLLPTQPNGQQTFAGPSHQYERFKQNIPPPTGALATTVAANQADFFMPRPSYSQMSDNYNYFTLDEPDDLEAPTSLLSGFGQLDRDMDYDSSSLSTDSSSFATDYVDPLGIGGQEPLSASFQPPQPQRFYPGMHQEAALAKAQAEAEQKKLQAQRQSQQPQRAFVQPGLPLRRSNGRVSHSAPDPVVEARISRLLNQMRQSSVASSNDDDTARTAGNGNSTQSMRLRKDEEDMDEDERLLASEEGKKLSSKERRQLRNKVSARAFRSRRKGKSSFICKQTFFDTMVEYIGQLEGEIAAKAQEAEDMKAKNLELKTENLRLTNLTRMLLSSDAFSCFLQELAESGKGTQELASVLPTTQPTQPTLVKSEPLHPTSRKDVNPHQDAVQQTQLEHDAGVQIGMTLIPDPPPMYVRGDVMNLNSWGDIDLRVYTVTDLPEGPALDHGNFGMLSGKPSNDVVPYPVGDSKAELPVVECMPAPQSVEPILDPENANDEVDFDETDPAFALFADAPSNSTNAAISPSELFGTIELEKVFSRLELVVGDIGSDSSMEISESTKERFERLCSSLEDTSTRISALCGRP